MLTNEICDELSSNFNDYQYAVNSDRAIPDSRSGLKPVARRVLYGCYLSGYTSNKLHVKCARIVGDVMGNLHPHGDCLDGSTKVKLLNGKIKTIKELYEEGTSQWVFALDEKTNNFVPALAHDFRIGQYTDTIYEIELINGYVIKCTSNHPFRTIKGDWVKAENLTEGEIIDCVNYNTSAENIYSTIGGYNRSTKEVHQLVYNQLFETHKDIIHHLDEDKHNNDPSNLLSLTRGEHAKLHGDYFKGLSQGRETMFNGAPKYREAIRKKNSKLRKELNKHTGIIRAISVLNKLVEENKELTRENYEAMRKSMYNVTNIDTLVKHGYCLDFEDLVNKFLNKTPFYTVNVKMDRSFLTSLADSGISDSAEKTYLYEPTIQMIYPAVHFILKNKKLPHLVDNINFVGDNTAEKWFTEEEYQKFLSTNLSVIKSIKIKKIAEKIPMYDFTVDDYHNMLIVASESTTLNVVVHNSSLYGVVVGLAQPWNMRYPLIDFSGNMGNQGGDNAAAYRYTEARLAKLAEEGMLRGINEDAVNFIPNYSETLQEPVTLPALFPNLLCNPNIGIGEGMACSWLPHNLNEVYQAVKDYTEGKEPRVPGPDFPTGGIIINKDDIPNILATGKGSVKVRGKYRIEDNLIVFYELPYMIATENIVDEIGRLASSDKLYGIASIRDESNKKGVRLVIECKKNVDCASIVKSLFAKTSLQSSLSYNQVGLVGKTPTDLNFKQCIEIYINHNVECIRRESEFKINKVNARIEILEGQLVAVANIDDVIKLIKKSSSSSDAQSNLMSKYNLTEAQAKAITSMRLGSLAKLEYSEIQNEKKELKADRTALKTIIATKKNTVNELLVRLNALCIKHGDARRTEIVQLQPEQCMDKNITSTSITDEVAEDVVVIISGNNIKKLPLAVYQSLTPANKLKLAACSVAHCTTKDVVGVFSSNGKLYKVYVKSIPEGTATSVGVAINKVISKFEDTPLLVISNRTECSHLLFATEKGLVKKVKPEYIFSSLERAGSSNVLSVNKDDCILKVLLMKKDSDILITETSGRCIKFNSSEIAESNVGGKGMLGIRTQGKVTDICLADEASKFIYVISGTGECKKFYYEDISYQLRGSNGRKVFKDTQGASSAVAVKTASEPVYIYNQLTSPIKLVTTKVQFSTLKDIGDKVFVGAYPKLTSQIIP